MRFCYISFFFSEILEFDTPREQTTDEYNDYFIRCRVKGNTNPTFMWSFDGRTFKEKMSSQYNARSTFIETFPIVSVVVNDINYTYRGH